MCPVFPGIPDYSTKLSCIYELVRSLPPSNHDTMKLLFGHLRRYARFLKKKSFLFYFIPFPSNNLRTSSRFKKKKKKEENSDSSYNHPIFFSLWQGHSIWGWQSHDCAECGNCIRPDSAAARDGVVQHHHVHGLPEPDRGVHPEWIRAHLLLKLKRSRASSADQGKRLNVLKLFEVLDLPLHAHEQL